MKHFRLRSYLCFFRMIWKGKETIYWQATGSLVLMRWQNVLNTETSLINTELIPAFSSTLKLSSHLELQHKVDHQALLAEVQ